jgi:menaquinone-specific isochorismate synthase
MAVSDGDETGRLISRARRADDCTPDALLAGDDRPRTFWATPDGARIVGVGAARHVTADGSDRFQAVRTAAQDLFAEADTTGVPMVARPRLFGGFAFHDGHEPVDEWADFPAASFVLPRVQVVEATDETWVTVNAVESDDIEARLDDAVAAATGDGTDRNGPPGIARQQHRTDRETWRGQVQAVLDRIASGELTKVVLAQALTADLDTEPSFPALLARLGDTHPDCHRFLFEPVAGAGFFGATPERLVSLDGRTLVTEALAGSRGRGDTPDEDEWLANDLLDSDKDTHEHSVAVEAIREQLDPLATGVRTGRRTIRRLPTVQHLQTPITADLAAEQHVLTLVEALHPTPTVGGLPPDAALATIRDTETFDRGWYAAPVGWIDAAGNGAFVVAIRSAVATDRRATLFAGAGIVADSDPDREWDEVQLKYRPVEDALE